MRNNKKQAKNINEIKNLANQTLISKLIAKNLKGGKNGCPPPFGRA